MQAVHTRSSVRAFDSSNGMEVTKKEIPFVRHRAIQRLLIGMQSVYFEVRLTSHDEKVARL